MASYEELKQQIIDENAALSGAKSSTPRRRSFPLSTWFMDSILAIMITLVTCGFPPADGTLNLDQLNTENGLELLQSLAAQSSAEESLESTDLSTQLK